MQFFIEDNTAKVMLIVGISLYTIILIFGIKNLIETRNKIIADRDYNQTKEYGVFLIVLSSIFLLMYVYMPIHLAINRDYYYPTTYQSRSRKSTNLQ
jgi:glucose uptake protein GlcU